MFSSVAGPKAIDQGNFTVSVVTRRTMLTASAGMALAAPVAFAQSESRRTYVATNVYPWLTFYRRDNRDFNAELEAGLDAVKASGVDGFEPVGESPEQLKRLHQMLTIRDLGLRSVYVSTTFHDPAQAPASLTRAEQIAETAITLGAQVIVTNPVPIKWNVPEDKTDEQLQRQAQFLNQLGRRVKQLGGVLAYHNHDMELRQGAREFHHMLVATDPAFVSFCLDAHWVYRGTGNSQVALFDVVRLYGSRIVELHLRNSVGGVWTEVFGPGDIDYARLRDELAKLPTKPLLVLEQAVEAKTPRQLDATAAHRRGVAYTRDLFADWVDDVKE